MPLVYLPSRSSCWRAGTSEPTCISGCLQGCRRARPELMLERARCAVPDGARGNRCVRQRTERHYLQGAFRQRRHIRCSATSSARHSSSPTACARETCRSRVIMPSWSAPASGCRSRRERPSSAWPTRASIRLASPAAPSRGRACAGLAQPVGIVHHGALRARSIEELAAGVREAARLAADGHDRFELSRRHRLAERPADHARAPDIDHDGQSS